MEAWWPHQIARAPTDRDLSDGLKRPGRPEGQPRPFRVLVDTVTSRRWLRGEATREATHELLGSTLEHVLRTFGAPPAPRR